MMSISARQALSLNLAANKPQHPPVLAQSTAEDTGTHSTPEVCRPQCKHSPQAHLEISHNSLMFLAIALTESHRMQLFGISLLNPPAEHGQPEHYNSCVKLLLCLSRLP